MESFARIFGFLITFILMFGPVIWFLYVTEVLSFLVGCFGGIFEEATKQEGIF